MGGRSGPLLAGPGPERRTDTQLSQTGPIVTADREDDIREPRCGKASVRSGPRTIFACQECGNQSTKWVGRCPECGNWNSYVEEQVRAEPASHSGARRVSISTAQPMPLAQVRFTQANRLRLAMRELNQVLGGGIVPGSLVLVGGDPGLVAQVLRTSRVWNAIFEAWRDGSSLAGSSAGAMALGSHSLIRATWPNRFNRRPTDALGLVPDTAVLPVATTT